MAKQDAASKRLAEETARLPEEDQAIQQFRSEILAAEEFEDKKRRGRVRFIINAFIKLCGKLGDTYEHQPSNEAMARDQDIVAVTAIANFLDEVSGSKGDLAYFANRFAMLAQRLQDDATIASRSDPSLVWIPRAVVSLAVQRLRRRGYKRKEAAEWIAKRLPELQQLITEKTAWDAKRSQSLATAINSWSRDFSRRDSKDKIKNHFAVEIYSRGLKALEVAPDCNDDDQIEASLQNALRMFLNVC